MAEENEVRNIEAQGAPALRPQAPTPQRPQAQAPTPQRRPRPNSHFVPIDGSAMQRPQRIWGWQLAILGLLVVVAAIIGWRMYATAMDNLVYAGEREAAAVTAQLSRDVSLDLPAPELFVGYADKDICDHMTMFGYNYFENETTDGTSLEIVKVPSDLTVEQGKTLFEKGIAKLSATEAAQLLNGMWRLDTSRGDGTVIRLRYADFKSGSTEAALTAAMTAQGLTEDSVTDSGMDDSGNTYKAGKAVINENQVTWRVSTLPLSEMYSISALPSTAMYVGIRYTF